MPGLVAFRRRWAVGSDDLIVSAAFALFIHVVWLIILSIVLNVVNFDGSFKCAEDLHDHVLGYIVILCACIILEALICWLSLRGTILYTRPREKMEYILYFRLAVLFVELVWLVLGVVWVADHYHFCPAGMAKGTVLGVVICNWLVMFALLGILWCTFDRAGRSWVKLKASKKQEAMKRSKSRVERRQSRAKVTQELYEANWDRRFRVLCCCAGVGESKQNSFAEIAKLFSEFFHELDVVPSDIIAGFMLLREEQKRRRRLIVANQSNDIYQFLSGVPITPQTKHLNLMDPVTKEEFKDVLYYFKYAVAAYGWPLYMIMNKATGLCKLAQQCRCCCCNFKNSTTVVDEDNCCQCNFTALKRQLGLPESEITYATFHSAVSTSQICHGDYIPEVNRDLTMDRNNGTELIGKVTTPEGKDNLYTEYDNMHGHNFSDKEWFSQELEEKFFDKFVSDFQDLDSIEQDSAESDRDFPDGISGSTRSSTRSSTEKQSF